MTPDELRAEAARLTAQADELETQQLTRADLTSMTSEQIEEARLAGQLDTLLGHTKEN